MSKVFNFTSGGRTLVMSDAPHVAAEFCQSLISFAFRVHERWEDLYFIFLPDSCLNESQFLCIPLNF